MTGPGSDIGLPLHRGRRAFLGTAPGAKAAKAEATDLTLEGLTTLYLEGVRRLVVRDAETAERTARQNAVKQINALLASRALVQIRTSAADAKERAVWQRLADDAAGVDPSRRGLFTRLAAPVVEVVDEPVQKRPPLAELMAIEADRPGALFAQAPHIDAALCTGCDACVQICPENALMLLNDAEHGICYDTRAENCTGCGLCVEVCDTDAIKIEELAERGRAVLLEQFQCRACGVTVHEPHGQTTSDGLCRICRHTGHHKKLFQVLT